MSEQKRPDHDPVHHPSHYTAGGIECIDALREALGLEGFVAYCRGAAFKYIWRAGKKDSIPQELRKGAWYLTRAAEEIEKATTCQGAIPMKATRFTTKP